MLMYKRLSYFGTRVLRSIYSVKTNKMSPATHVKSLNSSIYYITLEYRQAAARDRKSIPGTRYQHREVHISDQWPNRQKEHNAEEGIQIRANTNEVKQAAQWPNTQSSKNGSKHMTPSITGWPFTNCQVFTIVHKGFCRTRGAEMGRPIQS